jgi:putative DNA primase/helicase
MMRRREDDYGLKPPAVLPEGGILRKPRPATYTNGHGQDEPQAQQEQAHQQQARPEPAPEECFSFELGSELFGQPMLLHEMLVERVLTVGGLSVVYGGPNSGKTFLMLDLACCIARGIEWLGRYRVQRSAVLYLASEGPRSVRFRLQAYQYHYGNEVQLLAIVSEPVNLFASTVDAQGIIQTIDAIERATGWAVRLVVGDTLAAMSPGANENAACDMGMVLANIDRIVCARPVHFALVHHTGKDEARGMRGWSGLNARTDTAIEVLDANDDSTSHSAEVVKQRDVAGRRMKITFDLRSIEVGQADNFGNPLTSCIVETTDKPAPERKGNGSGNGAQQRNGKGRPNMSDGLVLGVLSAMPKGITRGDLVRHFQGKPSKATVYRSLEGLIEDGKVIESAGVLRIGENHL